MWEGHRGKIQECSECSKVIYEDNVWIHYIVALGTAALVVSNDHWGYAMMIRCSYCVIRPPTTYHHGEMYAYHTEHLQPIWDFRRRCPGVL